MKSKIPLKLLRSNIQNALKSINHSQEDSEIITDTLMYAELRNNNQGIVKLVKGGLHPNPNQTDIEIVHETPLSARLNGGQRIGMVVVAKSVELAIKKAKVTGVGIVGCSEYSSATGALGYWAQMISNQGFISVVLSQCPEMVAPYQSYEPIYGTNPLAIGIPSKSRPIVLDMATSAFAWYGLVSAKEEGQSIPSDIAYDINGNSTNDPAEALKGALRGFDRNIKSSHLGLMIELLSGAWVGAAMNDKVNSKNWGSLVIVIDPKLMGSEEEFLENVKIMCNRVKNAKKLSEFKDQEILLPGERGDEITKHHLLNDEIEISEILYEQLLNMINKQ